MAVNEHLDPLPSEVQAGTKQKAKVQADMVILEADIARLRKEERAAQEEEQEAERK